MCGIAEIVEKMFAPADEVREPWEEDFWPEGD